MTSTSYSVLPNHIRWISPSILLGTVCCTLVGSYLPVLNAAEPVNQTSVTIAELKIEPVLADDEAGAVILRGRDDRRQLEVTAFMRDGKLIDYTRDVTWSIEPADLAEIGSTGLIIPQKNGNGFLLVKTALGVESKRPLKVTGLDVDRSINFKHQITPIFTKLGCNGGGCHGKASGQNGFRLSLLGFYPQDDYEFLVNESRGRRLFPAAPDESLLLTKGAGVVPHGGGSPLKMDSDEYRLLYRWIEQGMPFGSADDPVVTKIACFPEQRIMGTDVSQQIAVIATYSDGHTEDVTRMALYEPNETEMAEVAETGLVTTGQLTGQVAIMARYQGQVATYRATIPLGADTSRLPKEVNLVDKAVFGNLRKLGIPASEPSDDATFLRRVSVDITGVLPTAEQTQKFLDDKNPKKRAVLIDQLLDSSEYANLFANKWSMILRNRKLKTEDLHGVHVFYQWIWNNLYENKPYDQMVREIITASGSIDRNPPVAWYREVATSEALVEDTAQLFLGLRIQCARCHHHPFEKWSMDDYYGMSAFFSRIGKKNQASNINSKGRDKRVFHNIGAASARNPKSGATLPPRGLGAEPVSLTPEQDPRVALADWMSEPDNPFLAPTLVNRYWKHFFGRGIVDPEDDMRATNPPANPELLDALAKHFVSSGYDMKGLVRLICNSATYQLSAMPNEYNLKDKQSFSRYYPKRLSAEVLYDALHQVTNKTQKLSGIPPGFSATQLRDVSKVPYFLKVFGQPQGETACECERSEDASLAQSLHLLNSQDVQGKISAASGRAATLAAEKDRSHEERLSELYLWAFSRKPEKSELDTATKYVTREGTDVKESYEDVVWALLNSKEFLFNH
ncbi:MAG: DUF1553 domain-containing protein [Planctomycetaceae bacterium]|nr:DUF1553 domain-containing protein [Planctomycetaceae bacterium]